MTVWVIADSKAATAELIAGAATLGDKVVHVQCDTQVSRVVTAQSIAEKVKTGAPDLVLIESTRDGRLVAGLIAAAMGISPLVDASSISIADGKVTIKRMVYGGAAFKTESAKLGTAVVVCNAGLFEAGTTAVAEELKISAEPAAGIRFKDKKAKDSSTVNLAAAKRVVCVGRGIGSEANLALAKGFATAIGAELGCSRPVAEESKLLPKEQYVGISGAMIKPELYVGAGISGQVQHMVGVGQALTIVAINKDKNAPIFKQCDYGIVGDLEKVLPALAAKLGK
jgi:electron transfer flavoprotein alpha subunit